LTDIETQDTYLTPGEARGCPSPLAITSSQPSSVLGHHHVIRARAPVSPVRRIYHA